MSDPVFTAPAGAKYVTPWRSVAATFVLNGILLGCWASRVPAFADKLDLNERLLGGLLLVMGIGALVSFSFAGKLSDKYGAIQVSRWLSAFYLLATVLLGMSVSIPMLAIALFFFGMTHGSLDVAMNSWAGEVERHMGRSVMSSFHAMWSLGAGLGAGSGYLASALGASTALHFLIVAGISGVFALPFLKIDWPSAIRRSTGKKPLLALPHGALILVGLMALGAGVGEGAAADWSAIFLKDVLGASDTHATLGYAIFSVTMVAMRLSVDTLITRYGPKPVARASGLLASAGYVLCATTGQFSLALLGFVMMGMGFAAVIPMAFTRAANDPHTASGQAIASVATFGYGAMLLGPPAIGFIAHALSLRASFLVIGGCALLIALLSGALDPARGRHGIVSRSSD